MATAARFKGKIFILGINPYVTPPQRALTELFREAGKSKGPIPVKGKLNGKAFIQTLVKYQGAWRLYLNSPMRRAAGIDVGDTAVVELSFDPRARTIPMNPKLKKALSGDKKARTAFGQLPPSRQKEIVRYINNLKTEESIRKNIDKILMHLNGNATFAGRNL